MKYCGMLTTLKKFAAAGVVTTALGAFVAAGSAAERRAKEPVMTPDSRINVQFVAPEEYTDLKKSWNDTSDADRAYLLEQFRDFLRRRGEQVLAEGLHLTIRVLDIDLAGNFEPWRFRNHDDIRVVRELYPARIHLAYELSDSAGTVLASGERRLSSFGMGGTMLPASDPLRHEKELLRNWLSSEFRAFRRG
jgi:hypothetical protein